MRVLVLASDLIWHTSLAESKTAWVHAAMVEHRLAQSFTVATPLSCCALWPRRSLSRQIVKIFWKSVSKRC
jgi:hypothetical protein